MEYALAKTALPYYYCTYPFIKSEGDFKKLYTNPDKVHERIKECLVTLNEVNMIYFIYKYLVETSNAQVFKRSLYPFR